MAIAGPPGAGKSTFAEALLLLLIEKSIQAKIISMDGFHLDNSILAERNLLDRKGAPATFDTAGFIHLMNRLTSFENNVVIPVFDRKKDLSIAGSSIITTKDKVLIVEGNYLLLNSDPWCSIRKLFDETWLLDIPIEVSNARVAKRHVATGLTEYQALKRVRQNDDINAKLIAKESFDNADKIIKYCA